MGATHDEEFVAFADASMRDLRRTAYLLCGDWHRAEDAVQVGLTKVYLKWKKLDRTNSVWSYARRAVVTSVIDDGRRAWWKREQHMPELPETARDDETGTVDDRLLLRSALQSLPRRQRAVVVLRYVKDLDVNETAFVLDCPVSTVSSTAARALGSLKQFLTEHGYVRQPETRSAA